MPVLGRCGDRKKKKPQATLVDRKRWDVSVDDASLFVFAVASFLLVTVCWSKASTFPFDERGVRLFLE